MPARIVYPALLTIVFASVAVPAQEPIRFPRTPDISPDGKLVAFSYLGDIWVVETIGGMARPITSHEAHEIYPAFSPDGRWIAFSSNRHGSYDVFVVSTRGGKPRRLTFDSAAEFVVGWTRDGKNVLFASTRSTAFPPDVTLYSVPFAGGPETPLAVRDGKDAAYSPKGDLIAYVHGPGMWYRKGYRGSANDDIWLAEADGSNHRRVTDFIGQDSSPMWSADGRRLYYVSEQFGTPANIVFCDLTPGPKGLVPGKPRQLTKHTDDAVRRARISANGEWIVYECGTDLWVTPTKDGSPRKLAIEVYTDDKTNAEKLTTFTSGATEFAPNPSESHVAFVVHGDIFLMPQAGGKAVRLTDDPAFDHGVNWSPDGKKIIFISDRNGHENLFELIPDDSEHPEMTGAQRFKVKQLTDSEDAIAAASFAPDGKRIAFIRAGKLWTMAPDGKDQKAVVGEPQVFDYDWSPDSKWLVYSRIDGSWGNEIFIVPAGGGDSRNVTHYATANYDVTWSATGMKLAFVSERSGPGGMVHRPFVLSLQKPTASGAPASSEIDWDDVHLRAQSVAPVPATAATISPDGARVAFRSADDLWVVNSDGRQPMRVTNNMAKPQEIRWSKKIAGGIWFRDGSGHVRLARVGMPVFAQPGVGAEPAVIPFTAKLTIGRDEEFAEMFEQSWRWLADSFYDSKLHGVDWNAVRRKYQPVVKHVVLKEDLYALISLMMGELNASHLGITGPTPKPEEYTAELGLIFDDTYKGPGKKVQEVLKHGPADKRGLNLKAGEVVIGIDRTPLTEKTNLAEFLNGKIGETVVLDVLANAGADPKDPKARRRVEIQGIDRSAMANLMYERWMDRNARRVDELSGGRFGYIHIPSMDQAGLDRFVRALYSDYFDKEAIVLDVRFNGGGYTHDQVLNYLSGKEHTIFRQRDGGEGHVLRATDRKWSRPLVLLINNQSYSDAEILPSAFRTMGLGKLVGQQTGGLVIGTGGVSLIDGSSFRIPRIGVYSVRGVNMEKEGVKPDVAVEPSPEELAKGLDPQLDKAVEVVKQDVVAWKKARGIPVAGESASANPVAGAKSTRP
jgi:tricorn protease